MYCIETKNGIDKNVFDQIITYTTTEEAEEQLKIFHPSHNAKIIELPIKEQVKQIFIKQTQKQPKIFPQLSSNFWMIETENGETYKLTY